MKTGKRQPPLWLDMDFAEALERFGQTDLKEVAQAEEATVTKKRAKHRAPPKSKKRGRPRKVRSD